MTCRILDRVFLSALLTVCSRSVKPKIAAEQIRMRTAAPIHDAMPADLNSVTEMDEIALTRAEM
jgi:hypothetical protein